MIKHTELRCGNKVHISGKEDPNERLVATVGEIFYFEATLECDFGEGEEDCTVEHEDLIPIPLSEEWLIRVGYRKHNNAWVPPNFSGNFMGDWQFTIYDYGHKMTYNSAEFEVELKSVHQLQNLYFTLTGEELTFKDL